MREKIQCFLTMFSIELDDLRKDIELLIQRYKEEHDHEVISNYVFLENVALMKNELFGIDSFRQELNDIDTSEFNEVNQLISFLKKRLLKRCHDKGIASSAYILSERKMNKVLTYIEKGSDKCS